MWCTGIRKGSRNHDPLWISEIHLPSRIMCSFLREGAGLSPHPTNHETTNTMKKRTNPHHRLQTHPPPICRLGSPEHPTAKRAAEKVKFSAAHTVFPAELLSGERASWETLISCHLREITPITPVSQLRTTSQPQHNDVERLLLLCLRGTDRVCEVRLQRSCQTPSPGSPLPLLARKWSLQRPQGAIAA